MSIVYIIGLLITATSIRSAVLAIKRKKWLDALSALLMLPWVLWFAVSVSVGGTAFHDALNDYAEYQPDHYYLLSHGVYTEVASELFHRMRLFEAVAWLSFAAGLIASMLRRNRENH